MTDLKWGNAALKLKSDSSFLEFLSRGRSALVVALLAVGLGLILLGGIGNTEKAAEVAGAEQRAAEMCALMDGVGECRVMMTFYPEDEGRVYGVLVLCEGAESVAVRDRITSLFCSLYGIGAHRVQIQKLKK